VQFIQHYLSNVRIRKLLGNGLSEFEVSLLLSVLPNYSAGWHISDPLIPIREVLGSNLDGSTSYADNGFVAFLNIYSCMPAKYLETEQWFSAGVKRHISVQ
jgi:hypothetical protein